MASVGEGGGAVGGDPERDGGGLRGAAAVACAERRPSRRRLRAWRMTRGSGFS